MPRPQIHFTEEEVIEARRAACRKYYHKKKAEREAVQGDDNETQTPKTSSGFAHSITLTNQQIEALIQASPIGKTLKALEAEKEKLIKQLEGSESQITLLKKQNKELEAENKTLHDELVSATAKQSERMTNETESLKSEIEDLKKQKLQVERENKEIYAELSVVRGKNTGLTKKCYDLEVQVLNLKAENGDTLEVLKKEQTKYKEVDEQIKKLEEERDELQGTVDEQETVIASYEQLLKLIDERGTNISSNKSKKGSQLTSPALRQK